MNTEMTAPATVTVANQAEADARIPGALAKGPCHLRIEGMEGPIDFACRFARPPYCTHCSGHEHLCKGALEGILSVTVSGGEKPIHPDWVRKIRDDCKAAGVPFTLESWGEWAPWHEDDGPHPFAVGAPPTGWPVGWFDYAGRWYEGKLNTFRQCMVRVGRERSGRTLDGAIHDGETGRTVGDE